MSNSRQVAFILRCLCKASFLALTMFGFAVSSHAAGTLEKLRTLPNSALLVVDERQHVVHSRNPDALLIPASTVKVLTGLIALEYWGKEHRFRTEFYLDQDQRLWIKGYGDPYLISEELDKVVLSLADAGIKEVNGLGLDSSYFAEGIVVQGQSTTSNPYDAPMGAAAVNFNTVNVKISKSGEVASAEKQTPLTPLAKGLSRGLGSGIHRINLGSSDLVPKYFAELLKEKLHVFGISIRGDYIFEEVPSDAERILVYRNQHRLDQVVAAMLEYSNNFIANQLYLMLGAERYGAPATMGKSKRVFDEYIAKNFDWSNYALHEGAGLSRENRLSAKQLIEVLEKFSPYRALMPKQEARILAKTGTLNQISTYAGYIEQADSWSVFALLINQAVPYRFREKLAVDLLNN